MDAKEFLTQYERMCCIDKTSCQDCPLTKIDEISICRELLQLHPDEAIAIVEAWAKANPVVTYKAKLLEAFPKADIMQICISEIYGEGVGMCDDDMCANCDECWGREVSENE